MAGGRPPKTLLELIRHNTFRSDRHRALLISEPLPKEAPDWAAPEVWRKLRFAQATYVKYLDSGRDRRRRESSLMRGLAVDYLKAFSRGVRALHGGSLPWLLGGD